MAKQVYRIRRDRKRAEIEQILQESARFFDLELEKIRSDRHRIFSTPRFMIIHYLRKQHYWTTDIAHVFKRDHSTVCHSEQVMDQLLEAYEEERENYEAFTDYITRVKTLQKEKEWTKSPQAPAAETQQTETDSLHGTNANAADASKGGET